jgi:hypothetical protein
MKVLLLTLVVFISSLSLLGAPATSSSTRMVDSPFGMVHADWGEKALADPLLTKGSYVVTWDDTGGGTPEKLKDYANALRSLQFFETPIIMSDSSWNTLETIQSSTTQYFKQNPQISIWQFGREENLSAAFWQDGFLEKLNAKFLEIQKARNASGNPTIQLAYQIAGLEHDAYDRFLSSNAAKQIDILAIHPYDWADFRTPEQWHPDFMDYIQKLLKKNHLEKLKIMYTEVGAPVADTRQQMYAYQDGARIKKVKIRGQIPQENAEFVIKLHAMAFEAGVEKVYWYHLRDRYGYGACKDDTPENKLKDTMDAECNFGLVNLAGKQRPGYFAYQTLTNCMTNTSTTTKLKTLEHGVRIYDFSSLTGDRHCIIAWAYPAQTSTLNLQSITAQKTKAVLSTIGKPIRFTNGLITVSGAPIFILTGVR